MLSVLKKWRHLQRNQRQFVNKTIGNYKTEGNLVNIKGNIKEICLNYV